jgi:DNA-binding response OmpR family regulator
VVEDDPSARRAYVEVLQQEGYHVVAARDGSDALRVLDRALPWLILLDLRLPVMGGAEFAHEVKRRGIDARIIVMTGGPNVSHWANEIKADGYLSKPFRVKELVDSVKQFRPDQTTTRSE